MKLQYRILWFEDNDSWYATLLAYIRDYLKDYGFELYVNRYSSNIESLKSTIQNKDYDLILMDYNLDGTNGDQIIEEIRNDFYTDIVFYSQNGAQSIRSIISKKGIDGVFCTNRELSDFEPQVQGVIRNTIKKIEDVNNMRGLVIAETIDLELKLEEIIKEYFYIKDGEDLDEKRKEYFEKICDKKTEQFKSKYAKIEEIRGKSIATLIEEDILTAYNLYGGLQSLLKENISEINIKLSKEKNPKQKDEFESKLEKLKELKKELNKFDDEIIKVRNTLAHVQEKSNAEGIPYLESLNINGTKMIFDNKKYIEIRKNLRKHFKNLAEIHENIFMIDSAKDEVAATLE